MKIVLWIGNEPNQVALANKINAVFPVSAIVTETKKVKRKLEVSLLAGKIFEKIFLPAVGKSWWNMLSYYRNTYPRLPDTEITDVENINSETAFNFTKKFNPDLILVSGTRLVRDKMLSISPGIGILNLHTGLSPYVKGGPNCTNWCIANEEFHLVGNTIMWIDKGIDSGNILTTEFTPISGKESLAELHINVMEHAHDLYIRAIKFLAAGNIQSLAQSDIAVGKTYFSRQWTMKSKIRMIKNFPKLINWHKSGKLDSMRNEIKTIPL